MVQTEWFLCGLLVNRKYALMWGAAITAAKIACVQHPEDDWLDTWRIIMKATHTATEVAQEQATHNQEFSWVMIDTICNSAISGILDIEWNRASFETKQASLDYLNNQLSTLIFKHATKKEKLK